MGKVQNNLVMGKILERILFAGDVVSYNPDTQAIVDAEIYGFIRNDHVNIAITNKIFETRLYNYFLSTNDMQESSLFKNGSNCKEKLIKNGKLLMEEALRKFSVVFHDLYGDENEKFSEAEGRRRFLLWIRPIINGTGNYYVEPQTRSNRRMDFVIDYMGERHVIELKIWQGKTYHEKGEKQLADYLDYYHLSKGYLLTYSFNKRKQPGVITVHAHGKELVEAII